MPLDGAADAAVAALAQAVGAVEDALETAGIAPSDLAAGVFNMAGADWPEDIAFWRDAMTARGFGRRVVAQNDALGVLNVASPDATGISIVCGTGVATGARSADGRTWHSSFWQDEVQGASHLGQKTLFAVYRSALGIAPPTSLTARVLGFFGMPSVEAVLHLFHDRHHPAHPRVDLLTPILLDEAEAGDAVALDVIQEHGAALGSVALVAARQVGLEHSAFPLVLAGGVFHHPSRVFEAAIVARVCEQAPDVQPRRSPAEPIAGVLIQALALAGGTDAAMRDRVLHAVGALTHSSTTMPS
jgi:N-acetylglucosamine kinase-like BadF-type ATPase